MKKGREENIRTIYSTENGRICPGCGRPAAGCACHNRKHLVAVGDGILRIRREVSGRGGKTVVVITGLPLDEVALRDLAKKLKKRCGTGGAVKSGNIEIQGEHCDLLLKELTALGYKVKLAGG